MMSRLADLGRPCVAMLTVGAVLFGGVPPLSAESRAPTPPQPVGPYYPTVKPTDMDNDLTVVRGQPWPASGNVIHLWGRVLDQSGDPVPGALVEIWQTNAFGRYQHPSDPRNLPLDPGFQGYGQTISDAAGAYGFRTVLPAPYPASPTWMRPPHIHFAVSAQGYQPLATQMYFEGNPYNAQDFLLTGIQDPVQRTSLIAEVRPPPPELAPAWGLVSFDIVLRRVQEATRPSCGHACRARTTTAAYSAPLLSGSAH